MKICKIFAICLSAFLFITAGCSTAGGEETSSVITSSASSVSNPTLSVNSMESSIESSKLVSSMRDTSSGVSSATRSSSTVSSDNNEWVAYDTNKDHYKLHIKKSDGTDDRVIVDDVVLAPCVAGEWVYYINPLIEIDKVKLDGSQKTKVCDIPEIMEINGSTAVTAKCMVGSILYTTVQMHEVGDTISYPAHYYKLNLSTNKITEVKS